MRPNAPMPEAAPPAKRRSLLHAETAIYSSSSDGSESPRSSEVEKAKWPGEKRLCAQAPSWAGLVAEVSRRAPPTFVSPAAGEHGDRSMPTRLHHEAQLEEMLIVVVPFRRRGVHLRIMLSTVSRYLDALVQHQLIQAPQRLQLNPKQERRRQEGWPAGKTGYCFIVAEQRDPRPFHRGLLLNVACLWAARQRSLNAKAHPLVGCPSSLPCGKATGVRNNLHEAPSASASTQHGADAQTGEPNNSTTYAREEGLEEAKGPLSKFTKQIREAQRVYVCLHDVDVVPKGRSFENNTREGQPCCYFPAPPEGVVRHLYGEPWSLSMVVCVRLEDFERADGHDLRYRGWGFEDEDFFRRCQKAGLLVQRGVLASAEGAGGNSVAPPGADSPLRRKACIWDQSGLEPIGSGAEIHADEGVAHADLTDDGIVRSKHGLQGTKLLVENGNIQLHVEPWPCCLSTADSNAKQEGQQQKHQRFLTSAEIIGDGSVDGPPAVFKNAVSNSDTPTDAQKSQALASRSVPALNEETMEEQREKQLESSAEDQALRRELLTVYGSRLVWLNVSLSGSEVEPC